ncbi:uncharacterized protein SPSK_10044 [Sporothrix schenckii 1099-18]|uniref:Uncharacterized protein n=1 Tax=Sporothrix schenckii 1099-18 TaxID=1397361 RepID=A0A0F2M7L8_SPOSC|nr:uncharacterized protein SPSK_10044 [Sporothrix schenckii 1099-18]KJR85632.1 hypothetical protein SPSK_10044 [Sporothrix schenckii 1099-18]
MLAALTLSAFAFARKSCDVPSQIYIQTSGPACAASPVYNTGFTAKVLSIGFMVIARFDTKMAIQLYAKGDVAGSRLGFLPATRTAVAPVGRPVVAPQLPGQDTEQWQVRLSDENLRQQGRTT